MSGSSGISTKILLESQDAEIKRLLRNVEELKKANQLIEELRAKEYQNSMDRSYKKIDALLEKSIFLEEKSIFLESENDFLKHSSSRSKTEITDLKKIILCLFDGGNDITIEILDTISQIQQEFRDANRDQTNSDAEFAKKFAEEEFARVSFASNGGSSGFSFRCEKTFPSISPLHAQDSRRSTS